MAVVDAVLFDWAGTLMHAEPATDWVASSLAAVGLEAPAAEREAWARRAAAAHLPDPRAPRQWTDHEVTVWRHRALDPDLHQALYHRLLDECDLPWPEAAESLYHRHMAPAGWLPYPDAVPVLKRLREAGVRCAVVSNIYWDIRPLLAAAGLLDWFQTVVCSYKEGVRKPDPHLFQIACDRLDVDPARTLMVGDSPGFDRGGEALGIRTLLVDPTPPAARPDGLAGVLAAAGVEA